MPERISIIIPTYNEADNIERLVRHLLKAVPAPEVIVSDGGSTDATQLLAKEAGASVVQSSLKGRAPQMNAGAKAATGSILYFLHADTFPPADYQATILENCTPASGAGCFRLQFDDAHWFLSVNAWFTRFDVDSIRFGDQSLYIRRHYFEQIGGFRNDYVLLEDQEIISRIRKCTGFRVLSKAVTTSAQKYRENGIYRLQLIFSFIWFLYYLGLPQQKLVHIYNTLIRKSKLKD
ncbi:TIGR04283 family arsenosugar biosynthesis glycosyltransferase [Pontibacter kalidii]|uniref:TIGR04283 family arsenosugar biosynthesis glycosyltransferase n=1 Tax=Pontibacter kalidii TaxID=2592049 RepID=UPI002250457D|nr:TIGR04283 family arsenosugar biosynthesis glycosyltransferase [Pontibacter kalidii]